MKLRQINIEYKAEEDRLLMRIASSENQEVLLWLTRRCVKLLWGVLLQLARSVPDIATQSHPEARSALMDMRHAEAMAGTDFSRPYQAATAPERPLGEAPLLVARLQTRRNPDGSFVLTLLPLKGQGINLNLDEKLLHSICGLLRKVAASTDWALQLDWPQGAAAGPQPERRTLN